MLQAEEPAADELEVKATEESPKAEEVATTLAPVEDAEEAKSGDILKGIVFWMGNGKDYIWGQK